MGTAFRVGFIGLGSMGEPMALNLVRAGVNLTAWNRSADKTINLSNAGARIALSLEDLFAESDVVFLMLTDGTSIDAVLDRGGPAFDNRVKQRIVINTSTVTPEYSKALENDIITADGQYVEAPVSGSRKPAELAQLVAMLAGREQSLETVRHLFKHICREVVDCGTVPGGLLMKLAVNLYLITMVTGLAEATHFAAKHELDMEKFFAVLNSGPMASDVSRVKGAKLYTDDFSKQAGITDVLKNNKLVAAAARKAEISSPLLDVCHELFSETQSLGLGEEDMIAVIRAIEKRSLKQQAI